MITDTTIYGYYVSDVGAFCRPCFDRDTEDVLNSELLRNGNEGIHPLYSVEDDGNGLSCDECGEYVFEPLFEAVFQHPDEDTYTSKQWGEESDLWASADVDGGTLQLDVVNVDSDYGHALAAFHGDIVVAVWATPDSPDSLADGDVEPL